MHDLFRQLAQHISAEECFCGDPQSLEAKFFPKLRRISIVTDKDSVHLPNVGKEQIRARTLNIRCAKPPRVESTIFKMLPCIRVLNLSGSSIEAIPACIGNLVHLRLLDLNGTDISSLPESIGYLINLQMLNLQMCKALLNLPLAITQLCNLRYLGLNGTPINQVPKGIGTLEFLNDLEGFSIGGETGSAKTQDGWKLEELRHLSWLRNLDLITLERAVPCSTNLLLQDKKYLKVLKLRCTEHSDIPYSEEDVGKIEKIFEQLIPSQNLEYIGIFGFFGQRYPTWLNSTHLSSVKLLKLIDCISCVHLPPLGQLPNLKYLRINGADAITKIGPEFVGCRGANPRSPVAIAFPKLEWLVIEGMPNCEEWSFVEEEDAAAPAMEGGVDGSVEIRKGKAPSPGMLLLPRLKKLELVDFPKLRALPRQFGNQATSLKELQIRGASCLKVMEDMPFLSALKIEGCEVLERVSNLPLVRVMCAHGCPNLQSVEGLGSLQQLWLHKNMEDISKLWVPELQQQCQQIHGEDLDVFDWV